MWICRILVLFLLCVSLDRAAQSGAEPTSGLSVLVVEKQGFAEAAGIRPGDILLRWSQGSEDGPLIWPIDLAVAFRERWPRGIVKIEGLHNGVKAIWSLGGNVPATKRPYGMEVESLAQPVKQILDHVSQLLSAKQFDAVATYCRSQQAVLPIETGARAFVFYQAGLSMAKAGGLKQADELFDEAVHFAPEGIPYFKAFVYRDWAARHFTQNDFAAGAQHYEQAIHEWETAGGFPLNLANDLRALGNVKLRSSGFEQAIDLQTRAVQLFLSVAPKHEASATALQNLASAYAESGHLEQAEQRIRQALQIMDGVKIKSETRGFLFYTLAGLLDEQSRPAEADSYAMRCLDEVRDIPGEENLVLGVKLNLGSAALLRVNLPRADYYLSQAAEGLRKAGASKLGELGTALTHLAEVKRLRGESAAAQKLIQEGVQIQERVAPHTRDMMDSLIEWSDLLIDQKDLAGAIPILQRALKLGQEINPAGDQTSICFRRLGEIAIQLGKAEEAKADCGKAETLDRVKQNLDYAGDLVCLASAFELQGKNEQASRYFEQTLAMYDRLTANLARADSVDTRTLYLDYPSEYSWLLFQQGYYARGFAVLDNFRASTLRDTLTQSQVTLKQGLPAPLLEENRKIEAKLVELSDERMQLISQKSNARQIALVDKQIAAASAEHELTENRMRVANPRYAAMAPKQRVTLAEVQRRLEPETLLLEYSLNGMHSFVLAVDRTHISFRPLAAQKDVSELAKAVYRTWSSHESASQAATGDAEQLSKLVLGPVTPLLRGKRRLVIVADRELQYVPFAALPTPGKTAQPLAASYEVVTMPAASLIGVFRENRVPQRPAGASVAILGDPVFAKDDPRVVPAKIAKPEVVTANRSADETDAELETTSESIDAEQRGLHFNRLMHSREEAQAIASVFPAGSLFMALDFDASRAAALRPEVTNSRIVHFATHGVFDAQNPALSGLVFSIVDKNGKPQPGFLGLDSIYSAHFTSNLVVLSACETALGKETNGEGLVGLTWGFIYAGARSVVASLWKVNDASTAELMRVFYDGMERKGLPPAEALRQAQLAISQKPQWAAPYYWAGFVIEGNYGK